MELEEMEKLKRGDTIYKATVDGVFEVKVANIRVSYGGTLKAEYITVTLSNSIELRNRGRNSFNSKVYFLTREEAEEAMLLKRKEKEKKIRLYQFEEQLNKELGLDGFYIKM